MQRAERKETLFGITMLFASTKQSQTITNNIKGP